MNHSMPYHPIGSYTLLLMFIYEDKFACVQHQLPHCLVPRYRRPVLVGKIKEWLKDQIPTIAETKRWKMLELQVMLDHVHLFISAPPSESPIGIVKVLKGVTGLRLFKKIPRSQREILERSYVSKLLCRDRWTRFSRDDQKVHRRTEGCVGDSSTVQVRWSSRLNLDKKERRGVVEGHGPMGCQE